MSPNNLRRVPMQCPRGRFVCLAGNSCQRMKQNAPGDMSEEGFVFSHEGAVCLSNLHRLGARRQPFAARNQQPIPTLRQQKYKSLYSTINVGDEPLKTLKLSNTRWLSIAPCVQRLLQQYEELKLHFQVARDEERNYTADLLYQIGYRRQRNSESGEGTVQKLINGAAKRGEEEAANKYEQLQSLSSLSPSIVLGQAKLKLQDLSFLSLYDGNVAILEEQWNRMSVMQWPHADDKDTEGFWINIAYHKDASGENDFAELSMFILSLLALPFSNASTVLSRYLNPVDNVWAAMSKCMRQDHTHNRVAVAPSKMADPKDGVMLAYRHFMTNEYGLQLNQPVTQLKKLDERNQIQILAIGKENTKPTKAFLLIGQTGAGKTCLINAMINYIMKVKFEDNSRYTVKDEIGTMPKSKTESQTEFVTGYLIYQQPGMAVDCNYLIIDTPGLGDTRGREQQQRIKKQMEIFLTDETFDISELHCLGFVVNGTINRSHAYLKEIVMEFESLFGNDTIKITKILATHTDDDTPAVSKVLEDINIKADKLYTFDNGVLYCSNQGKKARLSQMQWEILTGKYEEFFEDMLVAKPCSLRLCKEAIKEKMNLERSLLMLKMHIDNKVKALLQCRNKRKLYEEYYTAMRCNEEFEGEETITVKERFPINGRFTHAHNCPACEQTCVYPCTTFKSAFCSCPSGNKACDFCPCSKNDHKKEGKNNQKQTRKKTCYKRRDERQI
ncbi:uncharacterized protein LOC134779997 [Penaeus indicus]|uniref:uncharacterized protein LOC134779997 n=1 Tax=Penaeus indicus TaxID=29960 RepID=UPI00300C6C81